MDVFGLIGSVGIFWLIAEWVIRIGALFVVPRNRKPSSATAWLLVIFFFPFAGLILFLILGSPKLPQSRRDAQKNLDAILSKSLRQFREQDQDQDQSLLNANPPEKYVPIAKLSETLSRLPVFGGNSLTVLPEYDEVLERIVSDVDRAKHFVHVEYFIIALDDLTTPLFDAMARAVKRGVTVRVLYDSFATKKYPRRKEMLKRLEDDGIEVRAMLPFRLPGRGYVRPDLRNHRKLVVVDGRVGYTGSLNLVQRNYHRKDDIYYDELVVRIQGPAALQLAVVFVGDWYVETGEMLNTKQNVGVTDNLVKSEGSSLMQILPSGPGYDDENNLKLFVSLIHMAQRRLVIVNPYFVPDDALMSAITTVARRGVKVIMINSEAMDQWMVGHAQRSFYQALLEAGVKIYNYKAPVLLHSKFMTVDGEIAAVGSSNLDIRSFTLNLEVTLVSYDPKVVEELDKVVADYLNRSKQIELSEWHKRSLKHQLLDNIARLTAALQ